jgi:hypothetical protein
MPTLTWGLFIFLCSLNLSSFYDIVLLNLFACWWQVSHYFERLWSMQEGFRQGFAAGFGTLLILAGILITGHACVHRRKIQRWYLTVFAPVWRPRVARLRPRMPRFYRRQHLDHRTPR